MVYGIVLPTLFNFRVGLCQQNVGDNLEWFSLWIVVVVQGRVSREGVVQYQNASDITLVDLSHCDWRHLVIIQLLYFLIFLVIPTKWHIYILILSTITFRDSICHCIWHSIWHLLWHSIWNLFWHSLCLDLGEREQTMKEQDMLT